MSLPPRLDAALQRLASALDQLEAAAERRQKADAARGDLEEELAVMQDDRSRMAVDLDAALARNKALAHANSEVQRRLTRVSSTIQALLPDDASGEPS